MINKIATLLLFSFNILFLFYCFPLTIQPRDITYETEECVVWLEKRDEELEFWLQN